MGLWTLSVLKHLELFSISANCRLVRQRTVCGIGHWLFSPWNETSFEYSANILERLRSHEQSNASLNKIFPFPGISFACQCGKYNSCYFSTKFRRDKNEIEYSQLISHLLTIVQIKILRSVLCLCQSTSALRMKTFVTLSENSLIKQTLRNETFGILLSFCPPFSLQIQQDFASGMKTCMSLWISVFRS